MTSVDAPGGMTPYELHEWNAIQAWKHSAAQPGKQLVPEGVRQAGKQVVHRAGELWEQVPGNAQIEAAIQETMDGGFQLFTDAVAEAVTEQRVLRKYEPHFGYRPTYDDILQLDLSVPDGVAPDMRFRRSLVSAATGGAAGFVAGGATAAGAGTGGAAVLPAAGIFATAILTDTAATLANAAHCAATLGSYYGFDPNEEAERALIMSVIGAGLATGAAKHAAMLQVRDVSVMLAQKATWSVLNKKHLIILMKRIYSGLMIDTTKRSMAKGVPLAGAAFGAGMNYRAIRRSVITSNHLYRERFLVTKYQSWRGAPTISIDDIDIVHDRDLDDAERALGDGRPSPDSSTGKPR